MARVGIYSGAFDPVHSGHVAFALAAAQACALDTVKFVPEPVPRGKQFVTDIAHRMEMARLAAQTDATLDVMELPFKQFTVRHTLPMIRSMLPGTDLTLLVGSDVALTFPDRWDHLDMLFKAMELVVGLRAGHSAGDVQPLLNRLGVPVRVTFVEGDHITSQAIRESGHAAASWLDPKVAAYAAMHNLY